MNAMDSSDRLVPLEHFSTEFAARSLAALLADRDIETIVSGNYGSIFSIRRISGSAASFTVQIRQSQLELARLTIEDARADAAEIDWDQIDLGERTDNIPLTPVPETTPIWIRIIAIAGLILIALVILGWFFGSVLA